jgi:hypothetical protein
MVDWLRRKPNASGDAVRADHGGFAAGRDIRDNKFGLDEEETGRRIAEAQEPLVAHLAALEEWTRYRVPLQWAMTQMNLGTALRTLGERESGTARLREAVAAYRAALEEEKSVVAIAAREGRTPDEVAYDYITEAENRYLYFPVVNYVSGNLVFDFLPWVVFSGSGYIIAIAIACWPLLMCRRAMLLATM